MAAHTRDPAIFHRLHGAIFGPCPGSAEARTTEDLRYQADEEKCRRRRSHDRTNQDALRAAVSGLNRWVLAKHEGIHLFLRKHGGRKKFAPLFSEESLN